MTGSDNSIEERIEAALRRALNISKLDFGAPLRMASTPGWDSMGHMMVVLEIEKEFQIRFASYVLPQLVDVPSIAKVVNVSSKS